MEIVKPVSDVWKLLCLMQSSIIIASCLVDMQSLANPPSATGHQTRPDQLGAAPSTVMPPPTPPFPPDPGSAF